MVSSTDAASSEAMKVSVTVYFQWGTINQFPNPPQTFQVILYQEK